MYIDVLIAAISRASAAGLGTSYLHDLHDTHAAREKKLLLAELLLAVREQRTCSVRALFAQAKRHIPEASWPPHTQTQAHPPHPQRGEGSEIIP